MSDPILILARRENADQFVADAQDIFQDTLLRLYGQLRESGARTMCEDIVCEATDLILAGRWSDAATCAYEGFAPLFFEIAVYNDDYDTHRKATGLIGSFYFYHLVFKEAAL